VPNSTTGKSIDDVVVMSGDLTRPNGNSTGDFDLFLVSSSNKGKEIVASDLVTNPLFVVSNDVVEYSFGVNDVSSSPTTELVGT
jgi:hypothetical protein